jgi:hypothetical protein
MNRMGLGLLWVRRRSSRLARHAPIALLVASHPRAHDGLPPSPGYSYPPPQAMWRHHTELDRMKAKGQVAPGAIAAIHRNNPAPYRLEAATF